MNYYKGIALNQWFTDDLLDQLTDDELVELYAMIYCELLDHIEEVVQRSKCIEANLIIDRIMKNE